MHNNLSVIKHTEIDGGYFALLLRVLSGCALVYGSLMSLFNNYMTDRHRAR